MKKLCNYFYLHTSLSCPFNIYTKEAHFFSESELFQAQQCWFTPLTNKSKKKLGFWGTWYFCYTQSILVYDVTDTDCWARNGSTHGHHFKTFKCSETELKTAVRNFSSPFLWTEPIKVFHFSSLSNQRLDFNPTASYLGHWQRHHAGKPGHWWQSDRGPAAHPSLWG